MPELPEVELVRRSLDPVMTGARFEEVVIRRPNLRMPFPDQFPARLTGQTVQGVTRRAKYLLATLSSGDTLLMHLGMSGAFRVDPNAAEHSARDARLPTGGRHDHVLFHMSSGVIVTFNDPRRFGFMDLVTPPQLANHPAVSALGPEPLSMQFDAWALARACKGRNTPIKAALLDQRVVAGLGNIYVSEALHLAGLSPQRRASTITTPSGSPRQTAHRLTAAIKQVLAAAIERASRPASRSARFRVYDRAGEPCRTPRCPGTVRRLAQAGRSTYYCRRCQR